MESTVRKRAALDFSCPDSSTIITDSLYGVYRVEGCGYAATYRCTESASIKMQCKLVQGTGNEALAAKMR